VKYVLLVYEPEDSWEGVSTEERRDLHGAYHAVAATPGVIAHYRLRPAEAVTTVRLENDQPVSDSGAATRRNDAALRAIYVIESDDHDRVVDLAAGIPAVRLGGAVEIMSVAGR
jgi:hypothetical protein